MEHHTRQVDEKKISAGSKIYLRELSADDLETFNTWRNDSALIAQLVAPFRYINLETDTSWFENYMRNRATNVRCVICSRESPNVLLGSIGLLNIDIVNRTSDYYIMIGDTKNQGRGIGYEATIQILQHAFLNLNLNRVQLTVLETNRRAIALYEKAGFVHEGMQRQAVYKNGSYINLIIMSILKDEFTRKHPALVDERFI